MTGRLAWKWSHPESHMTNSTLMFLENLIKSGSLLAHYQAGTNERCSATHIK